MPTIRKTTIADIASVMHIINDAILYLKEQGIDQWQNGYPNQETIVDDIQKERSYVLCDADTILATCMITSQPDPTYNHIEGAWLQSNPYAVLHRVAVSNRYKGNNAMSHFIAFTHHLFPDVKSIRIDTHKENIAMQKSILKNGFTYCGIIYVADLSPRLAYEKCL